MHYNPETGHVELSVRELCALAFKGGHLDNRVPPTDLYRRASEGRDVHEKIRTLREAGVGLTAALEVPHRPRGSTGMFINKC